MTEPATLIIITGLSGSGKTTALKALEDHGFFCIDNLPSVLIERVIDLGLEGQDIRKLAFGIDVREGPYLQELPTFVRHLRDLGHKIEVIFLDADDQYLIRRYSETRRRHPLAANGSVSDAIKAERELLAPLRVMAERVIDTSGISPHELKNLVEESVLGPNPKRHLVLTLLSFGFRNGLPPEVDMLFDVRFLPNPHFIHELRPFTGKDERVLSYVRSFPETREFLQKAVELLQFLLPHYAREGKSYLTVGIGCTGGRHRSVAIARIIEDILTRNGYEVRLRHRDIPIDNEQDS